MLVASITRSPAATSREINSALISTGMIDDSFWRPSRGETSYIVTSRGSRPVGMRCGSRISLPPRNGPLRHLVHIYLLSSHDRVQRKTNGLPAGAPAFIHTAL